METQTDKTQENESNGEIEKTQAAGSNTAKQCNVSEIENATANQENEQQDSTSTTKKRAFSSLSSDSDLEICSFGPPVVKKSQGWRDSVKARLNIAIQNRGHAFIGMSTSRRRKGSKVNNNLESQNENEVQVSLKEKWIKKVDSLPRDFFTSAEAKLEVLEPLQKGGKAYSSLHIREWNNEDLKRVFGLRHGGPLIGVSRRTWANYVCTVGQYARFCVVYGEVPELYKLRERGHLFKLAKLEEPMRIFASYYEARGGEGSMCTKAKHLRRFCEDAMKWYKKEDDNKSEGLCQDNATRMGTLAQAYRRLEHANDRMSKTVEARIEQGRFITGKDFEKVVGIARKKLDNIMHTIDNDLFSSFKSLVEHRPGVVHKWCINILALLIMEGGGQRPQVYATLKAPTVVDLALLDYDLKKSPYFTLKTGLEKRPRPSHAPFFTLPKCVFDYVEFHVKHVLPIIIERCDESTESWEKEALLLHSETGRLLESAHVTSTLRLFMSKIDEEWKDITTMDIRSSFATRAIMEYNESRDNDRTNVPKETYLADLATHMNTSVNMLERVYAAVDSREYHQVASRVYQVFSCRAEK